MRLLGSAPHELWTSSTERHRMNLKPETAARQDGRIVLGKLADSSIAINVNYSYSIGPCRIRNQAKGYGSPFSRRSCQYAACSSIIFASASDMS